MRRLPLLIQVAFWTEYWQVLVVPTAVMGFWLFICYAMRIPIVWLRAAIIWGVIFVLAAVASVKDVSESALDRLFK